MQPGSLVRSRWAAIGAAVAITLGAGGISFVNAAVTSGERTVFVPITPCRLFDTRPEFQVGPKSSPLGANEVHSVAGVGTVGNCTLPTDAVALAMNVTAIDATLPTFLAVWPAGEERPVASSLNPAPGQPPTPNAVTTNLGANNEFSIYNLQGTVNVFADAVGYYADHNHDDRYYTEAEVDSALADKADNSATYTKAEVNAAIDAAIEAALAVPTSGSVQVPMGDFFNSSLRDSDFDGQINNNGWRFVQSVWSYTAGSTAAVCIEAPVDVPAGSTISSVDISYSRLNGTPTPIPVFGSDAAVDLFVLAVKGAPQTYNTGVDSVEFYFSSRPELFDSGVQTISRINVPHDPSEILPSLQTAVTDGFVSPTMSLCPRADLNLINVTVNYTG